MSDTATATLHDVEVLKWTAQFTDLCLQANVKDLSHEDSLKQPPLGANCLNWVVGHLVCIYNRALPLVGREAVGDKALLQSYNRGSKPLTNGEDAIEFSELLALWAEAEQRMQNGLQQMTASQLESPAPFSPNKDPNETVR